VRSNSVTRGLLISAAIFFVISTVGWWYVLGRPVLGIYGVLVPILFGVDTHPLAIASLSWSMVTLFVVYFAITWPHRKALAAMAHTMLTVYWVLAAVLIWLAAVPGTGQRDAIDYQGKVHPLPRQAPVAGLELHVFDTGDLPAPSLSMFESGRGTRHPNQPVFLVVHPTWGMLLFEAGISPEVAKDSGAHVGEKLRRWGLLKMQQAEGQDIRSQLKAAGFHPDRVREVVPSHFHPESTGGIESFPLARIMVDRRERNYATTAPQYNFLPHEWDDVGIRWHLVEFDDKRVFGPFRGALDIAGDGSMVLISTPGHTPGHVSLYVNLPLGPVLLAGDVAGTVENLQTRTIDLPFVSVDAMAHRAMLGRLLAFRKAFKRVTIVPGHDLTPLRHKTRRDLVLHLDN